jgi:hypothetical protein
MPPVSGWKDLAVIQDLLVSMLEPGKKCETDRDCKVVVPMDLYILSFFDFRFRGETLCETVFALISFAGSMQIHVFVGRG